LAPVWIRIFLPVFCCGEDAASAGSGRFSSASFD
jgi:hypothetical protein